VCTHTVFCVTAKHEHLNKGWYWSVESCSWWN